MLTSLLLAIYKMCPDIRVTWVYAGDMAGDSPSSLARINVDHALNLQLLAAHGYVVLIPSMPLKLEGETMDPYMELTKGVLPAVDRAIDLETISKRGIGQPAIQEKSACELNHSQVVLGLLLVSDEYASALG